MRFTISVFHGSYGCDCGCCGHYVEIQREDGTVKEDRFEFAHPWGEVYDEWAQEFARKIAQAAWPQYVGYIDWHSLDSSGVTDNC